MTRASNNMPYIKTEPEDYTNYQSNNFIGSSSNFSPQYSNQPNGSINPSDLTMDSTNAYNAGFAFGSQNLSGSFSMGGAAFGEDELLDSLSYPSGGHMGMDEFGNMPQQNGTGRQTASIPMNTHSTHNNMTNMYSNTPEGHPIQSPFLNHNFDFNTQYRPLNSIPQHMSPHQHAQMVGKRPSIQTAHRRSSDQRSPMTPQHAAMASLHIGSPDPISLQNGRAVRTPNMHARHSKTLSGQFDGTPGSLHSYLDSPLSSPANPMHHASISESISKHASLPTKVENGTADNAELKKRKRRASHNAVERRRRDNINERIQDLSHLVPQHRLDDDKVRKQLANQGPLSPIAAGSSMSPPNAATSLLAGASGRRAASTAGNITIGLPLDEKEKGPNKGDILNGSVSWTRDLMWALHQKYVQEEELAQYITQLGGTWPFQITEEDRRMRTELMDAVDKNDVSTFQYSRADGSGLRVPKHTTISGEKLRQASDSSPQSNFELSPGFHSGGSGANSGSNGTAQPQFWHSAGHTGISFKEEDEFMEIA